MYKTSKILFAAFISLSYFSSKAQLITSTDFLNNSQPYLDDLATMLMPPGTEIYNVVYIGGNKAIGKFNGNYTNIGLNNGIIMTTGTVTNYPGGPLGPNDVPDAGVDLDRPGPPPPLDALMTAEVDNSLHDAALLQFDFSSGLMQNLSFQYVFASEEYNEFVGTQYKDMFAIYLQALENPTPTNIAQLPVTGGPIISPTTINNGYSTGCSNGSAATNPQFFVDNCHGTTVQYDGFTTVLTANTSLTPNTLYKISFIIADVGDGHYDSGVFLKGVYEGADITDPSGQNTSAYPNPSNGHITLSDLTQPTQVTVYDMAGQPVYQQTLTQTGNVEINLEHLAAGVYTLVQKTDDGVNSSKIILQK